jgi:hypothetical protein
LRLFAPRRGIRLSNPNLNGFSGDLLYSIGRLRAWKVSKVIAPKPHIGIQDEA